MILWSKELPRGVSANLDTASQNMEICGLGGSKLWRDASIPRALCGIGMVEEG